MVKLLYIAFGGAMGAVFRYLISGFRFFDGIFPWGTLTVNLMGSFLIGFLWALFEESTLSSNMRLLIFTGFLGAFTTFSTFSLENFNLLRDHEIKLLLVNVVISNVSGIVLVFFGFVLARYTIHFFR